MNVLIKKSILSWFVLMSIDDVKESNSKEIADLILKLNKYLNKRKVTKIGNLNSIELENKLRELQNRFEIYITLPEDRHLLPNMSVRTIGFSPTLLAIQMLDDLMLIERDTELRSRFGHIDTGKLLMELEESYTELVRASYKIYKELLDE